MTIRVSKHCVFFLSLTGLVGMLLGVPSIVMSSFAVSRLPASCKVDRMFYYNKTVLGESKMLHLNSESTHKKRTFLTTLFATRSDALLGINSAGTYMISLTEWYDDKGIEQVEHSTYYVELFDGTVLSNGFHSIDHSESTGLAVGSVTKRMKVTAGTGTFECAKYHSVKVTDGDDFREVRFTN